MKLVSSGQSGSASARLLLFLLLVCACLYLCAASSSFLPSSSSSSSFSSVAATAATEANQPIVQELKVASSELGDAKVRVEHAIQQETEQAKAKNQYNQNQHVWIVEAARRLLRQAGDALSRESGGGSSDGGGGSGSDSSILSSITPASFDESYTASLARRIRESVLRRPSNRDILQRRYNEAKKLLGESENMIKQTPSITAHSLYRMQHQITNLAKQISPTFSFFEGAEEPGMWEKLKIKLGFKQEPTATEKAKHLADHMKEQAAEKWNNWTQASKANLGMAFNEFLEKMGNGTDDALKFLHLKKKSLTDTDTLTHDDTDTAADKKKRVISQEAHEAVDELLAKILDEVGENADAVDEIHVSVTGKHLADIQKTDSDTHTHTHTDQDSASIMDTIRNKLTPSEATEQGKQESQSQSQSQSQSESEQPLLQSVSDKSEAEVRSLSETFNPKEQYEGLKEKIANLIHSYKHKTGSSSSSGSSILPQQQQQQQPGVAENLMNKASEALMGGPSSSSAPSSSDSGSPLPSSSSSSSSSTPSSSTSGSNPLTAMLHWLRFSHPQQQQQEPIDTLKLQQQLDSIVSSLSKKEETTVNKAARKLRHMAGADSYDDKLHFLADQVRQAADKIKATATTTGAKASQSLPSLSELSDSWSSVYSSSATTPSSTSPSLTTSARDNLHSLMEAISSVTNESTTERFQRKAREVLGRSTNLDRARSAVENAAMNYYTLSQAAAGTAQTASDSVVGATKSASNSDSVKGAAQSIKNRVSEAGEAISDKAAKMKQTLSDAILPSSTSTSTSHSHSHSQLSDSLQMAHQLLEQTLAKLDEATKQTETLTTEPATAAAAAAAVEGEKPAKIKTQTKPKQK